MQGHEQRQAIRLQLDSWAQWASNRDCNMLGYPRTNILAHSTGQAASTDHIPVGVQQAEVIDHLVQRLRAHDTVLWLVLMCAYLGDPRVPARQRTVMGAADIAQVLHMHRQTVYTRRMQAEDWIADSLDADARGAAARRRDLIGG